jgi:hypothetical protein
MGRLLQKAQEIFRRHQGLLFGSQPFDQGKLLGDAKFTLGDLPVCLAQMRQLGLAVRSRKSPGSDL